MWLQTDGVKPPTPPPTPPANQNAGVGRANVELAIGTLAVVIGGILCCGLVAVRNFYSVDRMTEYLSVLIHFLMIKYIDIDRVLSSSRRDESGRKKGCEDLHLVGGAVAQNRDLGRYRGAGKCGATARAQNRRKRTLGTLLHMRPVT